MGAGELNRASDQAHNQALPSARDIPRGEEGSVMSEKIWDTDKLIQTDHLSEEEWEIIADIFKDFK